MSGVTDELVALEYDAWRALSAEGAAEYYDTLMAASAAMVLPIGIMDRATALAGMDLAKPWDEFELQELQVVEVTDDVAAVVYRARAIRGSEPYEAFMSSTYVRTDAGWRLTLHQQSPVANVG
jgi:hypothetical protein